MTTKLDEILANKVKLNHIQDIYLDYGSEKQKIHRKLYTGNLGRTFCTPYFLITNDTQEIWVAHFAPLIS
jgi:hypothetical protein